MPNGHSANPTGAACSNRRFRSPTPGARNARCAPSPARTTTRDDAMLSFDFAQLSPREKYKILIGSVVPRPIALVTTVDAEGRANAAPFSFFNALSADPPILALAVENHADLSPQDTTRNAQMNQE